jgi:hypothetical protein
MVRVRSFVSTESCVRSSSLSPHKSPIQNNLTLNQGDPRLDPPLYVPATRSAPDGLFFKRLSLYWSSSSPVSISDLVRHWLVTPLYVMSGNIALGRSVNSSFCWFWSLILVSCWPSVSSKLVCPYMCVKLGDPLILN